MIMIIAKLLAILDFSHIDKIRCRSNPANVVDFFLELY